MPTFNVTIPDSSPITEYSGAWMDTPKTDSNWEQYQNQTYHITTQDGATASLSFNGSAIYVYGARKLGYDSYSVVLDGIQSDGPATASVDRFSTLLFNATSLDTTKTHEIVIGNVHGSSQVSSMDIDYMVITAGDGNEQTTSQITFLNRDDPLVVYSASWKTGRNVNYSSNTEQITYFQGASATVTFKGNTIALYGTVNNDHGLFGVSIDGGSQTNFDGKAPEPRFQMLLYYASGLPHGQHTLKLTNVSPGKIDPGPNGLELDTVAFASWPDSGASSGPSSTGNTATTPATGTMGMITPPGTAIATSVVHHIQTSTIVGAIIGGLALFVAGSFLYCRHRRNAERQSSPQQNVFRAAPYLTPSSIDPGAHDTMGSSGGSNTLGSPHQTPEVTSATPTSALPFDSSWSTPARTVTLPKPSQSSSLGYAIREEESQSSLSHFIVSAHSRPVSQPTNSQRSHRDTPPPTYRQVYPGSSIVSS